MKLTKSELMKIIQEEIGGFREAMEDPLERAALYVEQAYRRLDGKMDSHYSLIDDNLDWEAIVKSLGEAAHIIRQSFVDRPVAEGSHDTTEGKRARDAMYQIGVIVEKMQSAGEQREEFDLILNLVSSYVDGQETTSLNESSDFPNMKEWWTEDPDKVMGFVYWLQRQIPPTDPEKKAAAWESLKQQLEKKHPSPAGSGLNEFFGKKKEAPNMSTADKLEQAYQLMTSESECFKEGNGLNYVVWGLNDDPFDRELYELGRKFTARLKTVAEEYRAKEGGKNDEN